MSAEEDTELRDLVAQTLETNGVLNKIRAELRANVFLALDEQDVQKKNLSNKTLKTLLDTKEGAQVFNLVREFLQFFSLDFTLAVFDPESNYNDAMKIHREQLAKELNIQSDNKSPLLLNLLHKKTMDLKISPPSSPKSSISSKIPQRISEPKPHNVSHNTDEISKITKSWMDSDPSLNRNNRNNDPPEEKAMSTLGSLKNAPPIVGVAKNDISVVDINSPEWDDLMKIEDQINDLDFKVPKSDKKKAVEYNYEDDFNVSNSQKSGLSVSEEIDDDLSIGSFAGSKLDDLLTTDQTVSCVSPGGFDYGEDAEI